jgi:RNA polymerase sigma factor (sigma-70 family)
MAQTQGTIILRQIRQLVAAQCPSQQLDRQLLERFIADRDEASFAALVQRHGSMVLGVCRSVLHHQQDAEDVFQAAFLVLARKAHTIRQQQALGSWLHGVAYRLALKSKAQASRRRAREKPAEDQFSATSADDLTWRELRVILHEELHRLPDKYRAPLLLCYWEGKTRDEAAEQLGLTGSALKKRLERGRNLLQSRLTRRGLAPSAALFGTLLLENGARAAVCSVLTNSTAKAAVVFAGGKGGSAAAPATAAVTLAEGAIRAMHTTKWAMTALAATFLAGLGLALGLVTQQVLQARQPDGQSNVIAAVRGQQAGAADKEPAAQKKDQERIVGTWRVTKGRADGKDIPEGLTALGRLAFSKDGKVTLTMLDEIKEGKYKLVGPGQIDMTLNAGKEDGLGIYKFEGDNRLTLCFDNRPGGDKRPTEYSGEEGTDQVLLVLDRAKPGEEKPTAQELAKNKEAVEKLREGAAREQSANNLKQIGLAFHDFHDAHNVLPLHAIYDKDGKIPLLSWRVAILPHIGEQALYDEFKLDEAWDSPHNKKLIAKMPAIYASPVAVKGAKEGMTYYQVFTGPDTPFDGIKEITFADIKDGTSNTLGVIEAKDPVIWTKPADLKLPKEKDKLPAVGGMFKSGFNVLLFDGSVHFFRPNPPAAELRALVTPDGGEEVDLEKLRQP